MENNTHNTRKTLDNSPDGCLLGCLGLIVGIVFLILSTWVLNFACYNEYGPVDFDGDYILVDSDQDIPAGTWVIENPSYFVHNEITVTEMENWRLAKLVISEDGTFELIQPTALLAKVLLVSGFELLNRESLDVSAVDKLVVRQAMAGAITGHWSKQTDNKNITYFAFSADENALPQRIQIARVKDDSIRTGRLAEGSRLHWSIYSHILYPKEGIVWKMIEP